MLVISELDCFTERVTFGFKYWFFLFISFYFFMVLDLFNNNLNVSFRNNLWYLNDIYTASTYYSSDQQLSFPFFHLHPMIDCISYNEHLISKGIQSVHPVWWSVCHVLVHPAGGPYSHAKKTSQSNFTVFFNHLIHRMSFFSRQFISYASKSVYVLSFVTVMCQLLCVRFLCISEPH